MSGLPLAAFGLLAAGAGAFCYVLVADVEPQPEYPELMTDLLRLLGAGITLGGLAIGAVFSRAAATPIRREECAQTVARTQL